MKSWKKWQIEIWFWATPVAHWLRTLWCYCACSVLLCPAFRRRTAIYSTFNISTRAVRRRRRAAAADILMTPPPPPPPPIVTDPTCLTYGRTASLYKRISWPDCVQHPHLLRCRQKLRTLSSWCVSLSPSSCWPSSSQVVFHCRLNRIHIVRTAGRRTVRLLLRSIYSVLPLNWCYFSIRC